MVKAPRTRPYGRSGAGHGRYAARNGGHRGRYVVDALRTTRRDAVRDAGRARSCRLRRCRCELVCCTRITPAHPESMAVFWDRATRLAKTHSRSCQGYSIGYPLTYH